MAKNIDIRIKHNFDETISALEKMRNATIHGSEEWNNLSKEIEDLNKDFEKLTNSTDAQTIALEEQGKSYQHLKDNVDKHTKSINDRIAKAKKLTQTEQENSAELKKNADAIKAKAKSLSGLEKASEKASQGWGSLMDGFGSLKSGNLIGGLTSITDGIKGMTSASLAFIATPIGATIAGLTAIAAVAKEVWDYNSAMADSAKITKQFTGLVGDELTQATVKMNGMLSRTGADAKESWTAVNAIVNNYGVSLEEAIRMVELGFVKAGESAEDYFDNVAEYSQFFSTAGYSAKEFFSVLQAGGENGIYKDKLVDSIKEADIKLKEMSDTTRKDLVSVFGEDFTKALADGLNRGTISTKDALTLMSSEVEKTGGNMTQFSALTTSVFGAIGEDAGGALKIFEAIKDATAKANEEMDESTKIYNEMADAQDELNSVIADMFAMSGTGFTDMKNQMMTGVYTSITKIIGKVIEVVNWFIELYNESELLRLEIARIKTQFDVLINGVVLGFNIAINYVKAFANVVKSVLTLNFEDIPNIIGNALKAQYNELKQFGKKSADDAVENYKNSSNKIQTLKSLEQKQSERLLDKQLKKEKEVQAEIVASNKAAEEAKLKAAKEADEKRKKSAESLEKKRRAEQKKTADEAKKLLDEYNKKLETNIKNLEGITAQTMIGGTRDALRKQLEDTQKIITSIANAQEILTKIGSKTPPTLKEIDHLANFSLLSINRVVDESSKLNIGIKEVLGKLYETRKFGNYEEEFKQVQETSDGLLKVYEKYYKEVNKLQEEYYKNGNKGVKKLLEGAEIQFNIAKKAYFGFVNGDEYTKIIKNLGMNDAQIASYQVVSDKIDENIKKINEYTKLVDALKKLKEDNKNADGTYDIPKDLFINYNEYKTFIESVKDLSEDTWKMLKEDSVASQIIPNVTEAYEKYKEGQTELNKLVADYKKSMDEVAYSIKDMGTNTVKAEGIFTSTLSAINRGMSYSNGGDILQANSKKDLSAQLKSTYEANKALIQAEMDAEALRLEKLGASEEQKNLLLQSYRDRDLANESEYKEKLVELDTLTAQRREAALSQTSGLLSQAAGLYEEHTSEYKTLAIASATIDTYQSAMSAYKGMVASIPGPWGIAAGVAAAASSVAFGFKQIKEISKVKFDGDTSAGGNSVANISQAPNVQFVSSGDNQIAQTIASSQASSEELQVTVLATDISNAMSTQAKVKNNSGL